MCGIFYQKSLEQLRLFLVFRGVAGQGGPRVRTPPALARSTHGINANSVFFWGVPPQKNGVHQSMITLIGC